MRWIVVVSALLASRLADAQQTQAEMNVDAENSFKKTDARLNDAWKKATRALVSDKSRSAKLKTAQKAWLTYRDATCEFEASEAEGGSMEPALRAACLARLTEQRTKDLEDASH